MNKQIIYTILVLFVLIFQSVEGVADNAKKSGKKDWGVVAPKNCFWECIKKSGCDFKTKKVDVAGDEDKMEHRYWMSQKVGGLHPLLGPVFIDGMHYQPIVLSGVTKNTAGGKTIMTKGSRLISDPHGIHAAGGWKPRCSKKDVETSPKPRVGG